MLRHLILHAAPFVLAVLLSISSLRSQQPEQLVDAGIALGNSTVDSGDRSAPLRGADLPPFSPNGKLYAAIGGNSQNMVRIWDVETERVVRRIKVANGGIFQALFSPDNTLLAICGFNGLQLFDAQTGREVQRVAGARHVSSEVAFSPDGRTIFTLDGERIVRIDAATGQTLTTIAIPPMEDDVRGSHALTLSPNGDLVAVNGGDSICIWRVSDGQEVRRIQFSDPNVNYYGSIFSGTGALLAAIGIDNSVTIWEVATGLPLFKLENELAMPESMSFSRDSHYIAASAGDAVIVWDALTGTEIVAFGLASDAGDDFVAERVAFTPDSRELVAMIRDPERRLPRRQTWQMELFDKRGKRSLDANRTAAGVESSRWEQLAGRDAGRAFRTIRQLIDEGEASVRMLEAKLREPPPPEPIVDEDEFARILRGLDDESYQTREKTGRMLRGMGRVAEDLLKRALGRQPTYELRQRIERLLVELSDAYRGAEFRWTRTVTTLELIGTNSAIEVLNWTAVESPHPPTRREAIAALARLRAEPTGVTSKHGTSAP